MMYAKVEINGTAKIIARLGLDEQGRAQRFHTANVLRRIIKYMPYRTGATIKITTIQTDINKPEIITNTPYARYLWHGKSKNGNPLNYTKTKNPLAGPRWNEELVAAEGQVLRSELQRFIRRGQ